MSRGRGQAKPRRTRMRKNPGSPIWRSGINPLLIETRASYGPSLIPICRNLALACLTVCNAIPSSRAFLRTPLIGLLSAAEIRAMEAPEDAKALSRVPSSTDHRVLMVRGIAASPSRYQERVNSHADEHDDPKRNSAHEATFNQITFEKCGHIALLFEIGRERKWRSHHR